MVGVLGWGIDQREKCATTLPMRGAVRLRSMAAGMRGMDQAKSNRTALPTSVNVARVTTRGPAADPATAMASSLLGQTPRHVDMTTRGRDRLSRSTALVSATTARVLIFLGPSLRLLQSLQISTISFH